MLGRSADVTRADLYLDTEAGLVPFASTHERHDESVPSQVLREVADRRQLEQVGSAIVAPLAATRDRVAAGVIVLEGTLTVPRTTPSARSSSSSPPRSARR
ncbi:hypothetical protein NKG05_13240 [Oerskovia sp. M15]